MPNSALLQAAPQLQIPLPLTWECGELNSAVLRYSASYNSALEVALAPPQPESFGFFVAGLLFKRVGTLMHLSLLS